MATQKEYKEMIAKVNDTISSAKSVVKIKKALKLVNDFLTAHKETIARYKAEKKYINRLNAMHDLQYELEGVVVDIEWKIESRSWSPDEVYQLSTFNAWID